MRSLAQTEQQRAASYLQTQARRGRSTNPKQFWLRNAIAVSTTAETLKEVAKLENVDKIVYDRKVSPLGGSAPASVTNFANPLSNYGNLTGPTGFERSTSGERAWHVDYIGADDVQEHGVVGSGVNVSVVDTGIDATHPALEGQVDRWKDFSADNYSKPRDPYGHGTHVAGLVAGKPDAKHAVGIAPGANLYGAKVFSKNGTGRISDIIDAFEWSANNSADVVSASVGVPPITDFHENSTSVASSGTSETNVTIYHSADGFVNTTSLAAKSYKPASVMVLVEPVAKNGTQIQNETARKQVMKNLSVQFVSPDGQTPLKRVEAGWAFADGQVPDQIGFYKFKPTNNTPIQAAGNWSLTVSNDNADNVTFQYTATPVYPTNGSDHLSEAVNTLATSEGIVPAIAAGNYGYIYGNRSISSPGAAKKAITVGASGYQINDVTEFSSRGPVGYESSTRPGIDVLAPGASVLSAYPTSLTPDGQQPYARMAGTSMSTPQVSGTVALLLAANPGMTRSEVESVLRKTAQPIPGSAAATGAGLVDAWAAVNQTAPAALSTASTEAGVHELFAGVGDTASSDMATEIDLVTDPAGDAGDAPDLRASTRFISDRLELVSYNKTPQEGIFRVYIDIDQNSSTGHLGEGGSEYRIVLNRSFTNGTYSLSTSAYKYNTSTDSYERTNAVSAHENDQVQGNFVGLWDIYFDNHPSPVQFDWHITSAQLDGQSTDRLPNTGQVANGGINKSIKGVAVAWNATAGQPDANVPVTFKVYNQETGAVVAQKTVETASDGRAVASIPVTVNRTYQRYLLEVSDQYNNTVSQTHRVYGACAECLIDTLSSGSDVGITIVEREYRASRNTSVNLTIPIYNASNGQMDPYTGPVSLRVHTWEASTQVVKNNLTAENGIVETTVDLSSTTIDDASGSIDVEASLTTTFDESLSIDAGRIEFLEQNVRVRVGPRSTVTAPGQSVSLSFQSVDQQNGDPVNESVSYTAVWITDRNVASLYSRLPQQTVRHIKEAREAALSGDNSARSVLTSEDKEAVQQALANLSKTQGYNQVTETGSATPEAHGVGTLQITPAEEARFGFVMGSAADSSSGVVDTMVFVDSRLDNYRNKQTEPTESTRYNLRVWSGWDDWGTHQDGGYIVPNSTYGVHVELYDTQTDQLVDNATVDLYTVTGDHLEVTTNGSGPVTVSVPAPNVDWVNSTYYVRHQEVIGIAEGYTTDSGNALTDREHVYGDVDPVEENTDSSSSVVNPSPELQYTDGTLSATIEYRNDSWEPVNGTRTLVMLGSPEAWFNVKRDYYAAFVDPGNQTTYSFNVTEPAPPTPTEPRRYEVSTRTGSLSENTMWVDRATAASGQITVDAPSTVYDGQTVNVTLTLRDRTGDPVSGAALVWRHQIWTGQKSSGETAFPAETDGAARIGITDSNGQVTFTITPTLQSDVEGGWVDYSVGYATANASLPWVTGGALSLQASQPVTVSGEVVYPNGTATDGDTVAAFSGSEFLGADVTNASGHYAVNTTSELTQDLAFYQINSSFSLDQFPVRDNTPDVYAIDRLTPSSDTDVGRTTLPTASVLNVTVVNESGTSVSGASITVTHINTAAEADASLRDIRTNADGMLQLGADRPGVEVNGTVEIMVTPPTSEEYVTTTYTRQVIVENATNLTVTIEETQNLTLSGTVLTSNGEPATGDELAFYSDNGGYTATMTDENGTFSIAANASTNYSVGFYQRGAPLNDAAPDVETLPQVSVGSTSTDLGNVTLPEASDLNVSVVNESGAPVQNASVRLVDWGGAHYESEYFGIGFHETTTDGAFKLRYADQSGIDAAGNVTVFVKPPDSESYVNSTYTRNLTVDNPTNISVTLEETASDITITGQVRNPNGTAATGDGVLLYGGVRAYDLNTTGQNGEFAVTGPGETPLSVNFYEFDGQHVRNGVPEMYPLAAVNATSNVSLGTLTLPQAHVLNVTVENESGNPVPNATVQLTQEHDGAQAMLVNLSVDSKGRLHLEHAEPDVPGIELNGTVMVEVIPPNATSPTYTETVTVNQTRNLTATINATGAPDRGELDAIEAKIVPSNLTQRRGEPFTVNVSFESNNYSAYGAQATVEFNTSVLNVTSVERGSYLGSKSETQTFANTTDEQNGTVDYAESRTVSGEVSGNGTLFSVTFRVTENAPMSAVSALNLTNVKVSDVNGNSVPVVSRDGAMNVPANHLPYVNATIPGGATAVGVDTSVTATANDTDGAVSRVVLAPSGQKRVNASQVSPGMWEGSFVFQNSSWNATASAYETVNVTVIAVDDDGAVNKMTVETQVFISGDTNGDGAVDIYDAASVGQSWRTSRGDANFSVSADLNNDGTVDIFDAVLIGQNWKNQAS